MFLKRQDIGGAKNRIEGAFRDQVQSLLDHKKALKAKLKEAHDKCLDSEENRERFSSFEKSMAARDAVWNLLMDSTSEDAFMNAMRNLPEEYRALVPVDLDTLHSLEFVKKLIPSVLGAKDADELDKVKDTIAAYLNTINQMRKSLQTAATDLINRKKTDDAKLERAKVKADAKAAAEAKAKAKAAVAPAASDAKSAKPTKPATTRTRKKPAASKPAAEAAGS